MAAQRIRIELSEDRMRASVTVVAGEALEREALTAALATAGVTFGIDAAALDTVATHLSDPGFACEESIATGRPMRSESNDACELAIAVGLQSGHQLDDGSFDYRERGLLTPVKRGQIVAHCQPAVVGIEGRTVTGDAIPFVHSPPRPTATFGEGLERQASGDVVATRDGVARRVDKAAIAVGDHYLHNGDVDLRSGHLEMRGSLTVTGDVTAKFEVQASGDVEIAKAVLRGTVYSGGTICVRGGVVGTGGGQLLAERDVAAEHGQGAVIHCGGTLHLRKAAIHCELRASVIHVDGPVRGGTVHAEHQVVVGAVGALMGGETELAVAVELERPLHLRFIEDRRERHLVDRLGAQLIHLRAPTQRVRTGAAAGSSAEADRELRVAALASTARIDVLGTIHAGSVIVIGSHRVVLDESHRRCRFTLDRETQTIRHDPLP